MQPLNELQYVCLPDTLFFFSFQDICLGALALSYICRYGAKCTSVTHFGQLQAMSACQHLQSITRQAFSHLSYVLHML